MYSKDVYGPGIGLDTRSNFPIGDVDYSTVVFKFIASHSSKAKLIRLNMRGGPGYSGGTGGRIKVSIQADNAGYPSGVDLTSTTWLPGNAAGHWEDKAPHTFDSGTALVAGQKYHVVFKNTDANSTANYISANAIWDNPGSHSPRQPAFTDDFRVMVFQYHSSQWINRAETPVFDLEYENGGHDGQIYFGQTATYSEISGTKMVRERFTVSGGNRRINKAGFRIAHAAGTGNVTIQIEDAGGTVLRSGTIASSNWPIVPPLNENNLYGSRWGVVTFPEITLVSGQTYNLRVSCPSGTVFWTHNLHEHDTFDSYPDLWGARGFSDGVGQRTNDGTTWTNIYEWAPNDAQCFMGLDA